MPEVQSAISLKQVNKAFDTKRILQDFSLDLPRGEVTCLIGPSGCGKTTLLRIAAGLLPVDSGIVDTAYERASFVFQEDRLMPWYDALGNLTAVGASEEATLRALRGVLLESDAHTMPQDLSGGMRRRLSIARALAIGGDCFFLDEPLRGLDPATAKPVLDAMRESMQGQTGLLITHSPEEALALAHTLLIVEGPPVRIIVRARANAFEHTEALRQWLQQSSPQFAPQTS